MWALWHSDGCHTNAPADGYSFVAILSFVWWINVPEIVECGTLPLTIKHFQLLRAYSVFQYVTYNVCVRDLWLNAMLMHLLIPLVPSQRDQLCNNYRVSVKSSIDITCDQWLMYVTCDKRRLNVPADLLGYCLTEETFDKQEEVMVPEHYIQVPLIIYHLDACDWLHFTVIPWPSLLG